MKNIFENAKFGDKYLSTDGKENLFCSFTTIGTDKLARLYRQDWGAVICYLDGKAHSRFKIGKRIDSGITGRWQEPIDEEKLDKLANEYIKDKKEASMRIASYNGFRAGYRKAMEDKQ